MGEITKTNKKILEESALALENKYVAYFENDFATETSNKIDSIAIRGLMERFAVNCYSYAKEKVERDIKINYGSEYSHRFGSGEFLQEIDGIFSNSVIEILNEIYIRALVIVQKKGILDLEEVTLSIIEGVGENYLQNYRGDEVEEFAKARMKTFLLRFEDQKNYQECIAWLKSKMIGKVKDKFKEKVNKKTKEQEKLEIYNDINKIKLTLNEEERFIQNEEKELYLSKIPEKYRILFWLSKNYIDSDDSTKMTSKRLATIYNTTEAVIKNNRAKAKKNIIAPKKKGKIQEILVPPNYADTTKISPKEEATLYRLLITENNEVANKIFKKLLKNVEEYWVLIRLKWIEDPSDLALTDLYNLEIEELENISNYYKSLLLRELKEKKIL